MAKQRLYRHDITILRAASATSSNLIAAANATIAVYRQGATVKTGTVANATTVVVYDTGGIRVNDVVQKNTDATVTWTVSAVDDEQLTFVAGRSNTLQVGDRLVVQTARPHTYSDVTGEVQAGTQGSAPNTGTGTGKSSFYTRQEIIDVIASGGGLSAAQLMPDQHGAMAWNEVSIEEFAGAEAAVAPAGTNNKAAFDGALDYADATGQRVIVLGPGTYDVGGSVALASMANGMRIQGAGPGLTIVNMTATSGAVFALSGSTTNVTFEDMTIQRASSNANLVTIASGVINTRFRRVNFAGGGGVLDQGTDTEMDDVRWTGSHVICLDVDGALRGRYSGVRIRSGTVLTAGIRVTNGAKDCEFIGPINSYTQSNHGGPAVSVGGGAGTVENVKFVGGTYTGGIDNTNKASGITITGGKGIKFIGPRVTDSQIGFSVVGGTNVDIIAPTVVGCLEESFEIAAGTHVDITQGISSNCSIDSSGTYDHVRIAAGVDDVHIIGLTVGNILRTGVANARHGVRIDAGASDRIQVLGVRGNIADLDGVWVSNASTSKDIDIGHSLEFLAGGSLTYSHTAVPGAGSDASNSIVGTLFTTTGAATYDVLNVNQIVFNMSSGGTAITSLTGGRTGQVVTLVNLGSSAPSIADSGNFILNTASGTWSPGVGDSIQLMYNLSTTKWYEISRSTNA